MFWYGETKQFQRKIVLPAPSLIPNIIRYQKFSKTQKSFSTKFSVVWDKIFCLKSWVFFLPPLIHKIFRYYFFWKTEIFPYDVFRYCEILTFRRKLVMSPVFSTSKFFDARFFLKHRMEHVQSLSALWDKGFPTEISDIPFLCRRCFDTRIYLKHRRGSLRHFLVLRDKNFDKKYGTPLFSYPSKFSIPEVFW